MFTGIIEALGVVRESAHAPYGKTLSIEVPADWGLEPGASVAINGACLTVRRVSSSLASFDVVTETLRKTNLGELRPGDKVNLERSLKAGGRIDGHFVLGHVDGVGIVRRIGQESIFSAPAELAPFLAEKGSVAVDGVSLTIVSATEGSFSVALIPFTLEHTTLGLRRPEDRVNIETDVLAKYVYRILGKQPITENFLRLHGFIP